MKKHPICPRCGSKATAVETRYGTRHSHCDLWSWDGKPLVSSVVHDLRKKAHLEFDYIWKSGIMSRSQAYKTLSQMIGVDRKKCHISMMLEDDLKKTIIASRKIRDKDDFKVLED